MPPPTPALPLQSPAEVFEGAHTSASLGTPARGSGPITTASPPSKFAYVTLFSNDAYLPGVLALQRSARAVNLRHPLLVMCTPSVSQEAVKELKSDGCLLRFVPPFETPGNVDHGQYVRSLYAECWNKLWMWEWEEFDRLVFLDGDMALRKNLDHLFTLPTAPLYAVGDCYGGRETEEERNKCCHFTLESPPEYFNAGFYVMRPSKAELATMRAALVDGSVPVGRFAEQDFLNGFYAGRWRHLPYTYNAQKRIKYHHPDLWSFDDVAVVHYVDDKPWSHRFSEENMAYQDIIEYWWQVYEQENVHNAVEE